MFCFVMPTVHSVGMSCQISVKLPFISAKLPLWRTAAMQCILCIDDPACFLTACVSQVHPGACSGWLQPLYHTAVAATTPLGAASAVPMQAGWNPVTVSAKVKRKTMPCSLPPIQQCTALTTGTASRQRIAGSLKLRTHRAIKTIWLSPSSHFKRETLFSGTFMT